MSATKKHIHWDLKITDMTQTLPGHKPRKRDIRLEGEISSSDGYFGYVWGRTRDEVIERARARKAQFMTQIDAEENAERIAL